MTENKPYTPKKILLTGGAGFIGSHVVEALLDARMEVVSVDDLSAGKQEYVDIFSHRQGFSFEKVDVSTCAAAERAIINPPPFCRAPFSIRLAPYFV